jgi:hypothetical protein
MEMECISGLLSLPSTDIPSSVGTLGDGCFLGCHSLSRVTFESQSKLSRVDKSPFADYGRDPVISGPSSVLAVLREHKPHPQFRRTGNWFHVCQGSLIFFIVILGILFVLKVYRLFGRGV